MPKKKDRLISLLQAKRRKNPKAFRKFLPEVSDILPEPQHRSVSRLPFGLTETERAFHREGLKESLSMLKKKDISKSEAIRGLNHYASLIRDDAFVKEVEEGLLKSLIKAVIGKSPGTFKAKTTVPIEQGGRILEPIAAMRGVYLDLDGERRLVSVTINPGKMREHRRLTKIVGIGSDSKSDVATRHDDYLATQEPHGPTQ